MSRQALTPEQLGRLCNAPAVMEILDLVASAATLGVRIDLTPYCSTRKLRDYIEYDGELPKCLVPAEACDSPEQSESEEECTLTPQQKYADELFSALEHFVKDSETMAELLKLKPEEWDNRYPTQKALIEKIKAELA